MCEHCLESVENFSKLMESLNFKINQNFKEVSYRIFSDLLRILSYWTHCIQIYFSTLLNSSCYTLYFYAIRVLIRDSERRNFAIRSAPPLVVFFHLVPRSALNSLSLRSVAQIGSCVPLRFFVPLRLFVPLRFFAPMRSFAPLLFSSPSLISDPLLLFDPSPFRSSPLRATKRIGKAEKSK